MQSRALHSVRSRVRLPWVLVMKTESRNLISNAQACCLQGGPVWTLIMLVLAALIQYRRSKSHYFAYRY